MLNLLTHHDQCTIVVAARMHDMPYFSDKGCPYIKSLDVVGMTSILFLVVESDYRKQDTESSN